MKLKKWCLIILSMCLLFCFSGCNVKDYFNAIDSTLNGYFESSLNSDNAESSSDKKDENSSIFVDDNEEVEEDETERLINPDNLLDYVALGLQVNKTATPRFESCTTESGSLRFYVSVSAELKAELDENENKRLAMLIYPRTYFDRVNLNNYSYMDWIKAFNETGNTSYHLLDSAGLSEQLDGSFLMIAYLTDMAYRTVNSEVVTMGVLITTDFNGNETYKYSTYASGNYRTNARSLAYVATECLSKYALRQESYSTEEIGLCKTYVNWSVDVASGLTEPTSDNSTYIVNVSPTVLAVYVGETAKIKTVVLENVTIPIFYKSLDEDIAIVEQNGNIKGLSKGSTLVVVYVAGVPYTVRVNVYG